MNRLILTFPIGLSAPYRPTGIGLIEGGAAGSVPTLSLCQQHRIR